MNFFKKSIYFFIFLASYCIHAQTVKVIDNKGTLKEVDNSKWSTSGSNIFNKNSGNVGIGASPDASAKLEVNSVTSGFLPPRLTTVQRDAIVLPATGLVVFNLTTNTLEINNGTPMLPAWTSSFTPDATTMQKGIVKLAGDLGGTADVPTVPGLAAKQDALVLTTTSDTGAATLTGATLNIPNYGSPFYLASSINDATSVKNSNIWRRGNIAVGESLTSASTLNAMFQGYGSFANNRILFNFLDSRDNLGGMMLVNGAGGSTFMPVLNFTPTGTNQALFSSSLVSGNDTGATPVFEFRARIGLSTQVATRPIFDFTNAGASALRILANRNVGIGTTSPATKLEIDSGTSGVSGLRFTNLTSAAIPSLNSNFLSLDASGNVIYATSGTTLPLINANGVNSATTEVRDYNVWANRGSGFYLTDNLAAIANPIPNNPAWFSLSQVAKGSTHFGQTALSDQGFWFRGGPLTSVASNTWLRTLSINANSRFNVQWDNSTNNTINLNNIDNGPLLFSTNNIERMRILANGNVGIGTSTPTAQFEVATSSNPGVLIRRGINSVQTPANLILQKTFGADPATHGAVTNGDFVGRILFSASNGSAYPLNGTDIVGYAAGVQSATNNGGGIFFRTVPTNSIAQSVERMRIEHNGNIGIGTSSPTTNLDVVGGMSLRNVAAAAGSNFGIEFNTNASSPRIDWVYNGFYTGSFAGDADNFFRLQNSRSGSGGFRFMTNPSGTPLERLTILNNGNIGVNVTNPTSKFEVNGSATNKAALNNGAANAIAFSLSNLAYTSLSAQAFNLTGMKDGGTYTLAVQGTTSGTASFMGVNPSGTAFSFKYINNGPTTAGKQTLYTFIVMGTTVYVYMATGF